MSARLTGPLFYVSLLIPALVGMIGVRFLFDPVNLMAEAGLPYPSVRLGKLDAYCAMCGVRNLALAVVMLLLALTRERKAFGISCISGPIISLSDDFIVYKYGRIPQALVGISLVVTTLTGSLAYICISGASTDRKVKQK